MLEITNLARSLQKLSSNNQDLAKLQISQFIQLPLFVSPLADGKPSSDLNILLNHGASRTNNGESSGPSSDLEKSERLGKPRLKDQDDERTIIRLFYDLFFVANLTTFTEVHEVNDGDSLKSYLGFFTILWFTWFQVTLYDVRLGNDCIFERVCKALQFGVMIGFAVVGPGYQIAKEAESTSSKTFYTIALILMVSRIVLAGRYAIALYLIKDIKQSYIPLLGHIVTLLASAAIFLGTYFVFRSNPSGSRFLDIWYIILPVEAASILLLSASTDLLRFRRNIVKRLGDLTLIILGEGVIGLCIAVRKVNSNGNFGSDSIGLLVSAIATIFFLWMLYFDGIANNDQQEEDRKMEKSQHIGTIRLSLWMIAHFPLNVGFLLVVEGLGQLTIWNKFLDSLFSLKHKFYPTNTGIQTNASSSPQYVSQLNETLNKLYDSFDDSEYIIPNVAGYFESIRSSQNNQTEISISVEGIYDEAVSWLSTAFEIPIPQKDINESTSDRFLAVINTFRTVFLYFFIAAGCTLVVLAVLFWLGKRHCSRGEHISISIRTLIGIGLSLLAIFNPNILVENLGDKYFVSPWVLPTVTIAYFVVVLQDHLVNKFFPSKLLKGS